MRITKQVKARFPFSLKRSSLFRTICWAIGLVLALVISPAALGQTPSLPLNLQQNLPLQALTSEDDEIATGKVRLDGRSLFAIAAPTLTQDSQQVNPTPIQERIRGIEATLERIANSNVDPQEIAVTAVTDASSNLPVISINDQYLMTVTTLDAQLQVQEPERWAERLTDIIEDALVRARQERQPEFLTRQSLIASALLIVMLGVSWILAYLQRRLKARRKRLEAQIPSNAEVISQADQVTTSDSNLEDPNQAIFTALTQQQSKRQYRNLKDVQSRLLQLGQFIIWVGGLFIILGLFPYSRWLQLVVLSAPLKILAIGLGIYVLMRVSDVLIDRFAGALAKGHFIDPEGSQRVTLRISTVSRVLKSGATVILISIGFFSSLSAIGVDLIPLLAGAGIVGLAISFAAQSLIKDMINGFLILFEDQFAVGDVISVSNVSGLVENMNLRITQLRDNEGQLITIPNSTITVVRNLSKDWSRVDLAIDLAYGTNPDHALNVIRQLAQEMYRDPAWNSKMPEPPEVLGIDALGHSGMLIRIWIKTLPLQQWVVAREFRRRLTLILDQEGLAIGVPQQSLWFRSSLDLDLEQPSKSDAQQLQRVGKQ